MPSRPIARMASDAGSGIGVSEKFFVIIDRFSGPASLMSSVTVKFIRGVGKLKLPAALGDVIVNTVTLNGGVMLTTPSLSTILPGGVAGALASNRVVEVSVTGCVPGAATLNIIVKSAGPCPAARLQLPLN
jgi:hypothetical protein